MTGASRAATPGAPGPGSAAAAHATTIRNVAHTVGSMPLRVLHSYKVYRPEVDGGIPFVIATLTRPDADGGEDRILVARLKGRSKRYAVDGVPVEAVASFGTLFSTPLAPSFPFALRHAARSCDIVVHHAPFPLADLALATLPADVPLIVYWHADIVGFPVLKKLLAPVIVRTLRRADRIIVADRTTIAGSALLRPFADKCAVVPYGIDVDQFAVLSDLEQASAQALRAQSPRMILAIGRLVPYKGFGVLLESLKDLDAEAVIIGEGPLESELRTKAADLGIAGRVRFAGRLSSSEMKAHLHAARVLAFPSVTTAEAFGIVQLEAMAAGLPIVNTSLGTAVPYIARHDHEALTVTPDQPRPLADALRRILDEPALAERLGRSGQSRARAEYSQQTFVSRVRSLYSDILEAKAQRLAVAAEARWPE